MREIKFRVWTLERMTKPIDLEWLKEGAIIPEGFNQYGLWATDAIFMQYTGLKDKNGKEIYEGDIIEYKYDSGSTFKGELVFGDFTKETPDGDCRIVGFYLRGIDIDGSYWYTDFPKVNHIEVIGNSYKNPELLK